jgi:hypothetical protein
VKNKMPEPVLDIIRPIPDHGVAVARKRNILSAAAKLAIYRVMCGNFNGENFHHGYLAKLCRDLKITRSTCNAIWARGQAAVVLNVGIFLDGRANIQRRLKYDKEVFKRAVENSNTRGRSTVRDLETITGIPRSTIFRYIKVHKFFYSIIHVPRPKLTPWHCENRVRYCREQIAPVVEGIAPHYEAQYHTFHLDEKWFYVDKLRRRVYLTEDEPVPLVQWQNKHFIEKLMFLAVVGRPIKVSDAGEEREADDWYWDGKVSFHPMVELGNISRRGPNVGNPCVKLLSIGKKEFEDFLCEKVLHDIAHVVPVELFDRPIYIQLDNATPHKVETGPGSKFYEKVREIGIDVRLKYQPSQSPDMNICDLSFFNSLQSLYYKVPDLENDKYKQIDAVTECWTNYDPRLLNFAWLTLFTNYNNILACGGTNGYKIKHMGKERLERAGLLPTVINVVDPDLVEYEDDNNGDDDVIADDIRYIQGEVVTEGEFDEYAGDNLVWQIPPLGLLGDGLDVATDEDGIYLADDVHELFML